jgi:hypothetical protein
VRQRRLDTFPPGHEETAAFSRQVMASRARVHQIYPRSLVRFSVREGYCQRT